MVVEDRVDVVCPHIPLDRVHQWAEVTHSLKAQRYEDRRDVDHVADELGPVVSVVRLFDPRNSVEIPGEKAEEGNLSVSGSNDFHHFGVLHGVHEVAVSEVLTAGILRTFGNECRIVHSPHVLRIVVC